MNHQHPKGLIIAATLLEIAPLLDQLKQEVNKNASVPDILITGIGLTSTTYSLTRYLRHKKPGWIIQAGVGGCFDNTVPLGSVFLIKQDSIADQSVVELGSLKTMFDLKLLPENQFPYKKGWLINKSDLLKQVRIKKVKAISVNEITTDKRKVTFYRERFNPVIESMEGAAFHYVCLMEQVPFLQIRSVSNYIAERNKKKWDMKKSIQNLNNTLVRILQNINQKQ